MLGRGELAVPASTLTRGALNVENADSGSGVLLCSEYANFCFDQRCYVFIGFSLFELDYAKTTPPIFTEFGAKVAHGPRKNPLDFGDTQDHVTPVMLILVLVLACPVLVNITPLLM